jgi:hypothetical protein
MTLKHQLALLALSLIGIAVGPSCSTEASNIEPGQTGVLVPVVGDRSGSPRFGLSLDIPSPIGSIEIRHLATDSTLLATELLSFDSSGNGAYQLDLSYLSVNGLIDIESLFPGLDLVGQLGGDPTASEPWVSEHTELNSGKIIWSFEDSGTVITVDPNAGQAEVQTPTFQGVVSAPLPLLELPASISIANLTPETIKASNLVPEPATLALVLIAGTLAITINRRREGRSPSCECPFASSWSVRL